MDISVSEKFSGIFYDSDLDWERWKIVGLEQLNNLRTDHDLKTGKKELKKLTLAKNSYGRFGQYCCLPQQR